MRIRRAADMMMMINLLKLVHPLIVIIMGITMFVLCGFFLNNMTWYCLGKAYKKALPPGSMGLPFFGETLHFLYYKLLNRPHDFARTRRLRYGDVFKTHVFGKPYIFASGARGAKMIMVNENKALASIGLAKLSSILGSNALLLIHGERHRTLRNIFKDKFTPEGVAHHATLINDVAIHIFKKWKVGKAYSMEKEVTEYTFNIMMLLICGWNANSFTSTISKLIMCLVKAVSCVPIDLPGFKYFYAMEARKTLVAMFQKELDKRRLGLISHPIHEKSRDLLDTMIDAHILSEDEIIDNLINFIITGQETTTSTLLFIVKHLSENSEALHIIQMESMKLQQAKRDNDFIKWEELRELPSLDKVIKEATRMSTPVSWWHREIQHDIEYDGYTYPKSWSLIFDSRGTHDSPILFPLPHNFDHQRFNMLAEPYTCLPFGVGPKTCLGVNLAKLTMSTFVYYLVTQFKWKSITPYAKLDYTSFTRPKGGVPILIENRLSLNCNK